MNEQQRAMLLDVISEWAGIVNDERSRRPHGPDQGRISMRRGSPGAARPPARPGKNITAYYRIQGPHLVIEYAPQTLGGDPATARSHHVPRSHQRLRDGNHQAMKLKAVAGAR